MYLLSKLILFKKESSIRPSHSCQLLEKIIDPIFWPAGMCLHSDNAQMISKGGVKKEVATNELHLLTFYMYMYSVHASQLPM